MDTATKDGWLSDSAGADIHIQLYAVNGEDFNADPQRYMVDAEGNYRMDSVGWGVCTQEEPDISGKAYWVLKDYIANGYGFITGHDTMYSYAGAYYDNFGVDLDEASIDPNDGTTWYYDINSWMPGTTASDHNGNTSTMRGGHFYMNQLMGSNAGNVNSDTVEPSDAPSMILSLGGSHGVYEKNANFGSTQLNVRMNGYSADMAIESPKYRTPTNYPYFFQEGEVFQGAETHTNQQAAFGPIWVDYYGKSIYAEKYGWESEPRYWTIDGQVGTNNFYLSGIGNYLMNQVGHLPENSASLNEARLFTNTVMFVSQRKQCEICAANQNGQETVHFVRRVNTANMDTVLKALQNGGSYWYPIDGCYQLTDSITLPEDWTAIKGFSGHWNSDVYEVKLNSKGTPLLANDKAEGTSGWNLGTNSSKGTQNVFNNSKDMIRTTGVARVLGDLNDLFGTSKSYAGYTVEIRGSDNTKYMSAGEKYSCTVNSDSKYVISNLPCIYDSIAKTGILKARVFDQSGKEVTEYGSIMVNVNKDFWNNDMTIPLYLGSFSAEPVQNYTTYESAQGIYRAEARSNEPFSLARWEYRTSASDSWETLPTDWDVSVNTKVFEPGTTAGTTDLYTIESTLSLNSADPIWNDYDFRAVFTSDAHGEWNTYEYYWLGSKVSNDPFEGASQKKVWKDGATGHLNVLLWPVYAESGDDVTANESASATFRAYGYALSDGTPISVQWEYGRLLYVENGKEVYDWKPVGSDNEFGGLEVVTTPTPVREQRYEQNYALHSVAPNNDLDLFWKKAGFYGVESKLTVKKLDIDQTGIRFRAHFTATSSHGTKYDWYSDIANEKSGSWNTSNGFFGDYKYTTVQDHSNDLTVKAPELWLVTSKSESFADGLLYPDLMTPDEYGQTLLLKTVSATTCTGTAAYQATIYYKPSELTPTPTWQYMTYTDRTPKDWNTQVAQSLGYTGVTVSVKNSAPVPATYNGESGWMAITSTMYIENAPITMYNSENLLKYYFRCVGTTSYETVRRTKSLAATDKWGGLTMDYAIAIWHNGVIGYDGANKVNGITATDANGLAEATKDKTYSDWYYPNLAIKVPTGHHVNTAIVYFDDDAGYNGQDSLLVDTAGLNSLGISVSQNNGKYLILVSGTKDTVETSTWERALREYVGFRTYDEANYTKESIINGTTGGGGIKWVVDEARFAGTQLDPSSGHLYKIVDWGTAVSWDTANQRAQSLDSELGMTGYLAEITSATENSVVSGLLGNRNAWLGGKRLSSGSWRWNKSNTTFGYTNWASGAQTTNANLYMKPGGGWNSAPVVTTTSSDKTYVSGWTAAAGASGTKVAAYTAPIYIPADYPNPHTVTVYFNAHSNSYKMMTRQRAPMLICAQSQIETLTATMMGNPNIKPTVLYGILSQFSVQGGTNTRRRRMSGGRVMKTKKFVGSFAFRTEPLTPEQEALVPKLTEKHVVDRWLMLICQHIKETTGRSRPIRNILLRGEPGTGKTEMYVGIAAGCHLPLYTFAANAMTEPFDMYGQFVPVDENGNQIGDKIPLTKVLSGLPSAQDMSMDPVMSYQEITGVFKENATPVDCMAAAFNLAQKSLNVGDGKQRFKFVPGQLIYAMKNGGVWGFDEVTLPMNPGVVPTLNPAMDNTQSITLPTGEIVRRHPDCIFVGTTNIDLEGCRNMNQAWQDRCQLIIDLPEPTDEVLLERLKAMVDFDQVPDAASIDLKRFVSAYKQLKEIAKKKRLDDGVIGPRKLADWVQSFLWVTRDPILSAEITIIPGATSDAGGISELRQKIQDLFK